LDQSLHILHDGWRFSKILEDPTMRNDATPCWERPVNRPLSARTLLVGVLQWLRHHYRIYRQRRALLSLDAAMLKDLGISRVDALQEGHKPFWRP
jgi:uncharacterized protein YjiS (DUF1127 family)